MTMTSVASRGGGDKHVFITVGTTSFDELIKIVDTTNFRQALVQKGYTSMTVQIGRGEFIPTSFPENNSKVFDDLPTFRASWYRFKPSLADDMSIADFIISHAGAGSILEALRAHTPLLVVVNEQLMDNHQEELASAMGDGGYLIPTTCQGLLDVLDKSDWNHLKHYPDPDYSVFPRVIEEELAQS